MTVNILELDIINYKLNQIKRELTVQLDEAEMFAQEDEVTEHITHEGSPCH